MGALDHWKETFSEAGWIIPPYISMGVLDQTSAALTNSKHLNAEDLLEAVLRQMYSPEALAPMITERYRIVPYVKDHARTIEQAIEAHVLGLHRPAVLAIVPVIEGVGRRLAGDLGITTNRQRTQQVLSDMIAATRRHVITRGIGAVDEIESMLDSFDDYVSNHLYAHSSTYPFTDGANRHGLTHGTYSDAHFGRPLGFYKVLTAINFLCFCSSLSSSGVSIFAPSPTQRSRELLQYYSLLRAIGDARPESGHQGLRS